MKRTRDTTKGRLYAAERAAWPSYSQSTDPRLTFEEIAEFLRKAWASKWLRNNHPGAFATAPPRVEKGHGCNATNRRIRLAKWGYRKHVALHELVHVVMGREDKYAAVQRAWHGREFAALYLKFVQHFMGKDEAKRLRSYMKAWKVKTRPRPVRKLSPEVRAAGTARLLAYHAKRRAEKEKAAASTNAGPPELIQLLKF